MSSEQGDALKVELIPIDQITVINPRDRGQGKFAQIVESIEKLGLKKPIRVCRRTVRDGSVRYDLVCGQGRLEAYKALGQTHVPAVVVEISRKDLLLQSLVENLARRKYNAIDLATQITDLEDRGYTCEQIAKKTNLGSDYVRGIVRLLRKGESRLIKAVEAGQIPITIAITIASSDDADVQRALADAYENKSLRGKEILKAKKLIEWRRGRENGHGPKLKKHANLSRDEVMKTMVKEMNRQRHLVGKAKLCETRLTFAVSSLRSLFKDDHFITLLRAEGLGTLPAFLHDQINGK